MSAPRSASLAIAACGVSIFAVIASPIEAQTADPFTNYTRYDAAGRVVGTISPDPDGAGGNPHLATRTTYDARGLPVLVESGQLLVYKDDNVLPSAWGTAADDGDDFKADSSLATGFDQYRRKVWEKAIGSDGVAVALTQYSYDSLGRLECTAVRMNPAQYGEADLPADACTQETAPGPNGPDRITKTIYDAAGQVLQVRVGVGGGADVEAAEVTYDYTPNGKIASVIDANGNRADYTYDGFDRLERWAFPNKSLVTGFDDSTHASALSTAGSASSSDFEEYTYDANGNRIELRKRDGSVITYTYDALNRMSSKVFEDIATSRPELKWQFRQDVHYQYNALGLQTAARFGSPSGNGILTEYDGFGRIVRSTDTVGGKNYVLSFTNDANGNRTSITYPDTVRFNYIYDGLDRLDYIADPNPGGGGWLANPIYNPRGLPSGNYRTGAGIDTLVKYDPAGRMRSLEILDVSLSSQVRWDYTRNPAGQIATETRDNDEYAWEVQTNFDRDYIVNGLNQYTQTNLVGGTETFDYCHDANGNLTADGTYVYMYDFENRLVQMRAQVNSDCQALEYTGAWKAEFSYDPMGRMRLINIGSNATRLVYDGEALIAEYNNGDDSLLRRYVHGSNLEADDPLVWYEGAGVAMSDRRHLYADPRGSIVLIADADGNRFAINAYDEYGVGDDRTDNTPSNGNDLGTKGRFRYTGQAWIPELGMYYYKARIYSPALGRFLQTDPIGYDDQFNLYAYVANDPINAVDPTGLEVIYSGPDVERLEAYMNEVAESDPEFAESLSVMKASDHVHELRFTNDPSQVSNSFRNAAGAEDFDLGNAEDPANASNGVGTGSLTLIFDGTVELKGQGLGDADLRADQQTQLAHEFFGHGAARDSGTTLRGWDANVGTRGAPAAERQGLDAENRYRRSTNQPVRINHRRKPGS